MFTKIRNLFFLFAVIFTAPTFATTNYSNIFVFGDSLSDTGNYASVFGPFSYPYWNGSFSNGKVSVEYVAEQMSADNSVPLSVKPSLHLLNMMAGTNYAVAGARASTNEMIDLSNQVNAFLLQHQGNAPSDALYIVFIGGNDLRDARNEMSPVASAEIIKKAVAGIETSIRTLAVKGAKHFFVVNAPDLGAIPETHLIAQQLNVPYLPALTTLKTRIFNAQLYFALLRTELQLRMRIGKFNLFGSSTQIANNAEDYGISNTTENCFSSFSLQFNQSCLDENGSPQFESFYYFDEIHPTGKVHMITGERMANILMRQTRSPLSIQYQY